MSTSKHLFRWHSASKNLADEFTRCHAWKITQVSIHVLFSAW